MMRAPLVWGIVVLALAAELGAARARADQVYNVTGKDSFTIGAGDIRSEVEYRGSQTLTVARRGRTTRFTARVAYVRSEQGASSDAHGSYVSDLLPTGEQLDSAADDPDYLTVLNQPFSVQLDLPTLSALRRLRAPLPFDFPSPFTSARLNGFLRRLPGGTIGARKVVGVKFEAGGPVHGALPDRPGLTLLGGITMRGNAYYDEETALLLGLDATVTISGNVTNRTGKDPVKIVYRRTLRAIEPTSTPTALKTGD